METMKGFRPRSSIFFTVTVPEIPTVPETEPVTGTGSGLTIVTGVEGAGVTGGGAACAMEKAKAPHALSAKY
jgi:hypothetical protein